MSVLIDKVKKHCLDLLTHSRCAVLPFHSVQHTLEVYENVKTIGKIEKLNTEELDILKIAALFHDTGVAANYAGHEAVSANNAHIFLSGLGYSAKIIAEVINCINATKIPQNPKTKLECVMCDADLFHLSNKEYMLKNELLRVEWMTYMDLTFTDEEWLKLNIDFLLNHKYHTDFGNTKLEDGKLKNIELMRGLKQDALH